MAAWKAFAVGLVACICLAGCSSAPSVTGISAPRVQAKFVPIPVSGEPTRGTQPSASVSAADEANARAAAAGSLRPGRTVEAAIATSTLVWQVPQQWWAAHRERPYEVVFFRIGSPSGGVGDLGTSAVVRATPDASWTVVVNDGSF